MHETALMEGLLATIEQALVGHKVSKVNSVHISVGKLANALPDALEFAFEALTQDGILQGAKLVMDYLPAIARCEACDFEYQADGFPIICPACHSTGFTIISGDEVYVRSIDCEES